jgi:hypothetical protein
MVNIQVAALAPDLPVRGESFHIEDSSRVRLRTRADYPL